MNNVTAMLIPSGVGIGTGLLYYVGLIFTLRALPRSRHPVRLFALSFLARTAITALGLFLLACGGQWENVIAGLAGFMLVRMLFDRQPREVPPEGPDGQETV